jgi:hypothetical protein
MRCTALGFTYRECATRELLAPEPDNGGLSGLAVRHLDELKAFAAHYGVRVELPSAASHWRSKPTISKKKPNTVHGNAL